jgi:hypothetical protein
LIKKEGFGGEIATSGGVSIRSYAPIFCVRTDLAAGTLMGAALLYVLVQINAIEEYNWQDFLLDFFYSHE